MPGKPAIHVNAPTHSGDTPLHEHDFYEIAVVARGRAIHRDLHTLTPIGVGSIILLQPGHCHAYEEARNVRLINLLFAKKLLSSDLSDFRHDQRLGRLTAHRQNIFISRLSPLAREQFERDSYAIYQSLNQKKANRMLTIGLFLSCLGRLSEHLIDDPTSDTENEHRAVMLCKKAMEDNITHDWGIRDLQQLTNLDPSYLTKLFRRHLHNTPMAWLTSLRCERAAVRLLTSTDSVSTIAHRIGWSDPNYFTRRFRKHFGLSPSSYRRQLPIPAAPLNTDTNWIQWNHWSTDA